jgi:hypothetical protein
VHIGELQSPVTCDIVSLRIPAGSIRFLYQSKTTFKLKVVQVQEVAELLLSYLISEIEWVPLFYVCK